MNHYEYRSRTQMPIQRVKQFALLLRETGITQVKQEIKAVSHNAVNMGEEDSATMRDYARHLIASMNYSVSQVQKELKRRKQK